MVSVTCNKVGFNLVPRSLVDEAEGEIWPNPICITWSPVRNVTGEASAHAQYKFGAVKADFVAHNKLTPYLRHDLGIFARITKFRCFHETKQTQIEFERFFSKLGRICFRILLRQSENFSNFCKIWSQFAFRDMIVPFYASSSARALKLPSISHTSYLTWKVFTKSFPFSQLLSPNLAKMLLALSPDMLFSCGDWATSKAQKKKMRTGGGVCKVLCPKSMCGRWRGAWARAGWRVWDLDNGTIMLQKLFNPKWQITSKSFLLSSFPIGFSFSPTAEISRLELEPVWRKFAPENRVNFQRGDWTGVKWSSQSRKTNFLTLPDLAFGFVHKRSGNESRSGFAILERQIHSNYNMACVTILAWWNKFASKWPRFWSKTNWKRFQRSWREKQLRGYRRKFWSILEIRGQCG